MPGRLPRQRDRKALAQQAEPHVQQDEQADNQRVASNAPALHPLHQHDIVVIAQRRHAYHKTAQQKIDHPGQYANRHDVRHKSVPGPYQTFAQKADRQIALQQVAEVHQQIEDEPPRNQRVEDTGPTAALPQIAESKPSAGRIRQPTRKLTPAWQIPFPPPDHLIDPSELNEAHIDRDGHRRQKN